MTYWLLLLSGYRAGQRYRETCKALRALDVDARRDIGVSWLEIDGAARSAALRAAV